MAAEAGRVAVLPVAAIAPDPKRPREVFDELALKELAQSILTDGLQHTQSSGLQTTATTSSSPASADGAPVSWPA